jgi:hypothetical protein
MSETTDIVEHAAAPALKPWSTPILFRLDARSAENNVICNPDGQQVPRDNGSQTCS